MSYRIDYTEKSDALSRKNVGFSTLLLMTLTVFVLFLSLVHRFRPDEWSYLQTVLLPGDAAVTGKALEVLMDDLRAGVPLSEAALTFCTEIFRHGLFY